MELHKAVEQLSIDVRGLFYRFYSVDISTGSLKFPVEMEDWVKNRFRSLERVEKQQIVTIKNTSIVSIPKTPDKIHFRF